MDPPPRASAFAKGWICRDAAQGWIRRGLGVGVVRACDRAAAEIDLLCRAAAEIDQLCERGIDPRGFVCNGFFRSSKAEVVR